MRFGSGSLRDSSGAGGGEEDEEEAEAEEAAEEEESFDVTDLRINFSCSR